MSEERPSRPDPGDEPAQPGPQFERRPLPSMGRLAVTGALFVLAPGLIVFAVLRALGVGLSGAGLAGLFSFVVGLVAFPFYLRRIDPWREP